MAYVKLDCGMLDSTLWVDRAARELFITALLMARPFEAKEPIPGINVTEIEPTGFVVPPGWYGFVEAAGSGIIRRAGMDLEHGLVALARLGEVDPESRTPKFDGRRMVRVAGGYIILNYDDYRTKDHTAAERARRYREKKQRTTNVTRDSSCDRVTVTQAEAEAEADKKKRGANKSRSAPITDEEWRTGLKKDIAYQHIDIPAEFSKWQRWCARHKKTPTQARFEAWLNRIEKPVAAFSGSKTVKRAAPSPEASPELTDEQIAANKAFIAKSVGELKSSFRA